MTGAAARVSAALAARRLARAIPHNRALAERPAGGGPVVVGMTVTGVMALEGLTVTLFSEKCLFPQDACMVSSPSQTKNLERTLIFMFQGLKMFLKQNVLMQTWID